MSGSQDKDKKVKVWMDEKDWKKIIGYCKESAPNEVIGMAHAEIREGVMIIEKPFILAQEVTSGTCEFDQKEFVKFIGEYDDIKKVRCVWHSHVRMSAFFSSCDRETSDALSMIGKMMKGNASWFISVVANIEEEYQCKIDMYKPFEATLEGTIFTSQSDFTKEIEAQRKTLDEKVKDYWKSLNDGIKKEVKEKVKRESYSGGGQSSIDFDYDYEYGQGGYMGLSGMGRGRGSGRGHARNTEDEYDEDDILIDMGIRSW